MFVNPTLPQELINAGYGKSKPAESNRIWKDVLLSKEQQDFNDRAFNFLLDQLKELRPHKGRLLDVGCSIGHFLEVASKTGYHVEGIELEPEARNIAKKKGFRVYKERLELLDIKDNTYDVVALLGLLEHLPNPASFMKIIQRILTPGGMVLFNGLPNINSLNNMILQKEARVFNGRNHLGYYNKKTLSYLLEKTGFKIKYFGTYVPALDSIINKIQMLDPFGDLDTKYLDPAFQNIVSKHRTLLEELIVHCGMGYKIRSIAIKV